MNKRKYLVYKIINRFNGKIYIGVHSTLNENDRYMGSGVEIREALKKEGRKSFVKKILFIFETKEEMLAKEKELVTKEFCIREDTYNRIEGGGTYLTLGMVVVVDKEGNTSKVYNDDPRYLSGELVGIRKGASVVNRKGKVLVKNENNEIFLIDKKDTRYISGELIFHRTGAPGTTGFLGKEHSEESKKKIGLANSKKQGEANSQYGTCWITKEGINKKIKKENFNEFQEEGWIKGRK